MATTATITTMRTGSSGTGRQGSVEWKERKIIKLKEALGGIHYRTKSQNTCDELEFLKDRYKELQNQIKEVIRAVKTYHTSMTIYAETQVDVAEAIADLADAGPLKPYAGYLTTTPTQKDINDYDDNNYVDDKKDTNKINNKKEKGATVVDGEDEQVISQKSYWYYHDDAANRMAAYTDKYEEFIVNYAIDWEKKIQETAFPGIKEAETLRRNVDHYEQKVKNMSHSTNQTLAKGRTVDPKMARKLGRNEEKYHIVQEKYTYFVADMCTLLAELTDRAWKDLHPLLMKMVQFDKTTSSDRAKALRDLWEMADALEQMGDRNGGFHADALLNDIEEELHFNKKYLGEALDADEDSYDYETGDEKYDAKDDGENYEKDNRDA